ncbi:porin [Hydrogenophaga crocea]|uniref:Porin n=1 Tax=Hydrogenophaga crocea TaxID=2716225 RepID=A0A6G8IK24_9BURK|nr:porin [Hydrogenophaga crocea]QIM53378.1 porin [Hydrogenophaga crocea]
MKKTLLIACATLASGAAFAQSSVTLYGLADMYLSSQKNPATGLRTTRLDSSGIYESRFGFKGSEDLGGGTKANFQLESGFAMDNGGAPGLSFTRQSWVGLSGGFGDVRFGKAWSAFDDISGSALVAKNSVLAPNQGAWLSTSYRDAPNNGFYYASPDFGGFSGVVSYGMAENKTATVGQGSISSVHVKYAAGPVFAGAAYQTEKATGNAEAIKFTRLNGSYQLGPAKLMASYGRVAFGDAKTNEWALGTDYALGGAWTISAGIAQSKGAVTGFTGDTNYTGKLVTTVAAGAPDVKRTGYSVAAFYSLSKRTTVYGGYRGNTIKTPGAADQKGDLFALGLLHLF